jgi:predicted aspartyl protease
MKIIAALVMCCLSTSVFAGASAWIPIEIQDGHIIIPISLNGEPARALLDSGSTANAISYAYLEAHEGEYSKGQGIVVSGIKEKRRTAAINNVELGIFGTVFEIDQLAPADLGGVDFIVGLPFFELFVVQIDYPGKQMRVVDHGSIDMKKFSNVRMKRAGGSAQPLVRVDMNGDWSPWLMLDTGNNGAVFVGRSKAERQGWLENFGATDSAVTGANAGVISTEEFRLPTFTIGPFELENVLVAVPAAGEDTNLTGNDPVERTTGTRIKKGKKTDGNLGFDVLQHFVVTIDMKRSFLNLDLPR